MLIIKKVRNQNDSIPLSDFLYGPTTVSIHENTALIVITVDPTTNITDVNYQSAEYYNGGPTIEIEENQRYYIFNNESNFVFFQDTNGNDLFCLADYYSTYGSAEPIATFYPLSKISFDFNP